MELSSSYCLLLLLLAYNVINVSPVYSLDPWIVTNPVYSHPLRNPLFPPVVQDFVADSIQEFRSAFNDPEDFSILRLTPEEAFTLYYDMSYNSNREAGNPNSEFHALSKAQSVKENYNRLDGEMVMLVTAYTAGELLLQKDLLTPANEKSLASLFAQDIINSIQYVSTRSVKDNIRLAHEGYVKFLISTSMPLKENAFVTSAVYVEVINALSKNYQIPREPQNFNIY